MSAWPWARTAPVARSQIGAGPLAVGCIAAIFGVPVLTFAVFLGLEALWPSDLTSSAALFAVQRAGPVFLMGPFIATPALLLAVPASRRAAEAGWGGWLVAALAGAGLAGCVWLALWALSGTAPGPWMDTVILLLLGATQGSAFWLGVRLAAPDLFGARA
jgi:hypothetical protein